MHNSFSKIMSLTGQTSVAHCLGGFREVSPPERVHSLSDLKCTMVGRTQNPKDSVCQGARKRQAAALGFQQP